MNTDVHCPECGAITRTEQDDEGDVILVCADDDCPRIVVAVLSRRYAPVPKRDLDEYWGFPR